MKSWHIALLLLTGMLAAGMGGYGLRKTQVVYVDRVSVKTDTLWLAPAAEIRYVNLPAKHDTVRLTLTATHLDTVYLHEAKYSAFVETDLISDSVRYGHLTATYYYPPWDTFDIKFAPAPMPLITTTQLLQTPVPWHRNRFLWMALGLATGAAINGVAK